MGHQQARLLSLINFAQASAKLKASPVSDASKHHFCEYEHNLQGLPGVHFNAGGHDDEVWLVVERLREINAPIPSNPLLALWIEVFNNPAKQPSLKTAIESVKLVEAGFLNQQNVDDEVANQEQLILLQTFEQAAELESLFKAYLIQQWGPWAIEEKRRRLNIQLYGKLFTLKQQLDGSISDAEIELAWGVGIAVWDMVGEKVSYPLITGLVDLSINEKSLAIEIRPRDVDARLELDIYTANDNLGAADLEKAYKAFVTNSTQIFSPFDSSTFDGILRSAAACLDAKGVYWPTETSADDRKLPAPSEDLKITDTWVLLARPRSKSLFVQDLENFKTPLDTEVDFDLPKAILALVTEPANTNQELTLPSFRGLSMVKGCDNSFSQASSEVADLYFPMAFNDEQVRIVQLLDAYDGVVVQGPPGTGKTHTIANIIAHNFALGKRVLVTSMKEPALAVLRDKLPEAIRPLAISLLSNEQEGMKQFEQSISRIAAEIQTIDRQAYKRDISQLEQSINGLHGSLARIDNQVMAWAKKNLDPILMDQEIISPIDAAKQVIAGQGQYEWLEDKLAIENSPLFSNADIARLREARREIAADINYLGVPLPELSSFIDSEQLIPIHHDLSRHAVLNDAVESGQIPPLVDSTTQTIEALFNLQDKVNKLLAFNQQLDKIESDFSHARVLIKQSNAALTPILDIFDRLGSELSATIVERNQFLARPITISASLEMDEDIVKAIKNQAAGKSAFGLTGLIAKGDAKKKLKEIRILTSHPSGSEDWRYVESYIVLQTKFRNLVARWNSIATELALNSFETIDPNHAIKAAEYYSLHITIREQISLERQVIQEVRELLPTWNNYVAIESRDGLQELQNYLDSHALRHRLANTWSSKAQLQAIISIYNGNIIDDLKAFIDFSLGNPLLSEAELLAKWSDLLEELKRIHQLKAAFADVQQIANQIQASGAEQWAEKLRCTPVNAAVDLLLPDNWQAAWRLRRLTTYLENADARQELKQLGDERHTTEKQLAKTYQEIVAKRTWLKLAENATPDIRSALEAFRIAVAKIGKGTGKRAAIFRQNARNASERASQAIPCWIMPHWRVSESLPTQFGYFDLVIIDEASQSDLSALPALLRAKKVLIVGDDKQVSPDGGFIEIDKIKNLMARHLGNQVDIFRAQMDPGQSIYDLFKVVFAESGTMLKEHFRCVSPIIEYSKREVYNHELKPVRLPKASERLDPPLIDVLIEDGFRKGDINIPEARFIVDEIKKICDDEAMQHRTIGVVSLLSDKQALEIWKMLEVELGHEVIKQHDIACGDARTFQGKERDIMFLSMLVSVGDAHAQTRESTAQRFNVAASRARDRMYLVRSIELDQLSPNDKLRRKLISHFAAPYAQDEQRVDDLRLLCESEFEQEIYDILVERGYRVIPQVKVGEYRIDMVVEGHNDSRLAIECDGDRYHGADRWEHDMNRQRILERVGWKFWRCFASTFVRNRQEVVEDLIATLLQNGVDAIGSDTAPRSLHSEHRRVLAFPLATVTAELDQ